MNAQSIPPIFVINLKRHKERRQHIVGELQQQALPYRLIDAVDGELLCDDDIKTFYSEDKAIKNKFVKRPLVKNEIACALSHISIYKIMLAEDIKETIILEDDAVLNKYFAETVQATRRLLPEDWQLLLLGYGDFYNGEEAFLQKVCGIVKTKSARLRISLPLNIIYCAHAYLINQSGARQLLEKTKLLDKPIDCYTGDCQIINVYCIEPRCVRINYTTLKSALHEDRVEMSKKYQTKLIQFKQQLNKKFPFILDWRNRITCIIKKLSYYAHCKKTLIGANKISAKQDAIQSKNKSS